MNTKIWVAGPALMLICSASVAESGPYASEVRTPLSINESAPTAGIELRERVPDLPGTAGIPPVKKAPAAAIDARQKSASTLEFWKLGDPEFSTGAASGVAGSGVVGSDPSVSGETK